MPETRKGGRRPASALTSGHLEDAAAIPLPASLPASPSRPSHAGSDSETESSTGPESDQPPPGEVTEVSMETNPTPEECSLRSLNPPCYETNLTTDSPANGPSRPTVSSSPDGTTPPVLVPSTSAGTQATCPSIATAASTHASAPPTDAVHQAQAAAAANTISAPGRPTSATTTTAKPVVCMTAENGSRLFIHPFEIRKAIDASIFAGKLDWATIRTTGGGFGLRFEVPDLCSLSQAPETVTRLGEWAVRCWVIDPDPSNCYTYGRIYPVDPDLTNDALAASIELLWGSQSPLIRVFRLPPSRGSDGEKIPNLAVRLKFKGPLPDKVTIDRITYAIRPHTLPVLQCYRCLLYGHGKAVCRGPAKCHTCSGPHDASGCTRDPSCCYCGGKHRPTSRNCPAHMAAADIQLQHQENKLSFAEERQKLREIKPGSFQSRPRVAPSAATAPAPWRTDTRPQAMPTPSAPPLIEEPCPQVPSQNIHPTPPCPTTSKTVSTTISEVAVPHPHTDSVPPVAPPAHTVLSLPAPLHTHTDTDRSLPVAPPAHTDLSLPTPIHTHTDRTPPVAPPTHTDLSLPAPLDTHTDISLPAAAQIPIPRTPPRKKTAPAHTRLPPSPKSPCKKQPPQNANPVEMYPLYQHPFRNPQSLTPPPSTQPPPPPHPARPVPWPQQSDSQPTYSSSTQQQHQDQEPTHSSSTQQQHQDQAASSTPSASSHGFSWFSIIPSLVQIITTFFSNLMAGLSLTECFLKSLPTIQTLFTSLLSSLSL